MFPPPLLPSQNGDVSPSSHVRRSYLFALSSDRRSERGYCITAAIIFTLTGLIALVTASTNASRPSRGSALSSWALTAGVVSARHRIAASLCAPAAARALLHPDALRRGGVGRATLQFGEPAEGGAS
ncbi:uncharacterized protein P884DRAFT_273346 [Thermothelomyces heterothallicus CBS 202.75]|uniref:uncharacterized protein n=1 Tax=Thermothelomyces heterothallicus CBS 202.75 TaxID=1149848 RepID=UPI003741F5D3